MSTLTSTLGIRVFRDSLSSAVALAQTDSKSILAALRSDHPAPKGADAKSWPNLVGAVRLAYVTAQREDSTEVVAEIRAAMADQFSTAELDLFVELLTQDDAIDAQSAELLLPAAERRPSGPRLDVEPMWHGSTAPAGSIIWTLGNKG